MEISTTTALQSNTQTSQTNNAKTTASLDYTAFLRLLIAQMQNQDPTNPTDPAQWMGQIASFSNVEQSIQANAKLDALMTSTALSQVDGLIGHTITSEDGSISGKVSAVRIINGGSVAILENGKELLLGAGVKVS
jgi:flagellar basal-body rod modification protein FlgD